MTAEAGFQINGRNCPVPSIETFDMDEASIFYDYTKLTIDQLFDMEGLPPTLIGALAHIAVRRADPTMKDAEIRRAVGKMNLLELATQFASSMDEGEEEDAVPPTSGSSSTSSDGTSGTPGETTSETRPASVERAPTGTPSSADGAALASVTSG